MSQTILLTGATDGIGLETAKMLLSQGHHVLLHGRSPDKLQKVTGELSKLGTVESFIADLSDMASTRALAKEVAAKHASIDVLINNAGILKAPHPTTPGGHDIRFAVNTLAPYLLTKELLPLLGSKGRVINLSSAAQAPVNLKALASDAAEMDTMDAYSQSKLAITMWSRSMAASLGSDGPTIIAVNPGSLLGSKMVKEGFGMAGKDIGIGASIITRLATEDEFSKYSGLYFDNDAGQFSNPHPDALDDDKCQQVVDVIEKVLG